MNTTNTMGENLFTLVMIEDDDGHARLIEKNLHRAGIANKLVHLRDGQQALEYFLGTDSQAIRYDQILILLDLNLPMIDGYEVLKQLKGDARTHTIPVIILTTTDNPREIDRCYELGCNVYMTKPVAYEQFSEAIRKLGLMLAIIKIPHGVK
jgi:CheY-like chemotaxis protein